MPFTFQLEVAADSATPALRALINCCEPRRLAETLRDPLLNLVRDNYIAQPPNKMGAPSTGYWRSAAESTYAVTTEDGLTITTDKIGVRQHLYGGPIHPISATFLAIPACAETHGKHPRDFTDLVVTRLIWIQYVYLALVKSTDMDFIRSARNHFDAASKAMFWLTRSVNQEPDDFSVIPFDDEFADAIEKALTGFIPTDD